MNKIVTETSSQAFKSDIASVSFDAPCDVVEFEPDAQDRKSLLRRFIPVQRKSLLERQTVEGEALDQILRSLPGVDSVYFASGSKRTIIIELQPGTDPETFLASARYSVEQGYYDWVTLRNKINDIFRN